MSAGFDDIEQRVLRIGATVESRHGGGVPKEPVRTHRPFPRSTPRDRAVVVGALAALALLIGGQIGNADVTTRAALRQFPVWWGGQSESGRVFGAGWPAFAGVEAAARNVATGDKVLVFRMAEIGFYTRLPFVYAFDNKIAPVFRAPSPQAARDMLLAQGVRWILVPDYPMAEIYNSPIGGLIADPDLAALDSDTGFRLFRLVAGSLPRDTSLLAEERFSRERPAQWEGVATRRNGAVPLRPALAPVTTLDSGWLQGRVPGHGRTDTSRILEFRPKAAASGAAQTAAPGSFVLDAGRALISAEVGGTGRMELVVRTASVDGGASVESIVWNGSLWNATRTVTGQYLAPVADAATDPASQVRQVILRLRGPGEIRFGGWRATRFDRPVANSPDPLAASKSASDRALARLVDLTRASPADFGWSADSDDIGLSMAHDGLHIVWTQGPSPRVVSGWLVHPDAHRAAPNDAVPDAREVALRQSASAVAVSVTAGGDGAADIFLSYRCEPDDANVALRVARRTAVDRNVEVAVPLPCRPALARLEFAPVGAGADGTAALTIENYSISARRPSDGFDVQNSAFLNPIAAAQPVAPGARRAAP